MTDRKELAERIVAAIFFNDASYRPQKRDAPLTQEWDKAVECAIGVLDADGEIVEKT